MGRLQLLSLCLLLRLSWYDTPGYDGALGHFDRYPRKRRLNLTAAHVSGRCWVLPQPDRWMDGWHMKGWRSARVFVGWVTVAENWGGIPGPLVPVEHSWDVWACKNFCKSSHQSLEIHSVCEPVSLDFRFQTTAKQDGNGKHGSANDFCVGIKRQSVFVNSHIKISEQ